MCMQNRFQCVYSAFGTSLHISFLFPSSIAHWCPHVFFSCEAFGLGTSRKCSTVENISFEQEKGPYLEVVSLSCDSEHDSEWWSANQCIVRRCLCVSCPTSANWGHVIKANALSARTHCTIIISPLPLSMGFYMHLPQIWENHNTALNQSGKVMQHAHKIFSPAVQLWLCKLPCTPYSLALSASRGEKMAIH